MGIKHKQRIGLLEVMESSTRSKALEKTTQVQLLPPPPTQPLQPDLTNHKRKRNQKSHEVVEGGNGPLLKEAEL